MLKGRLHTHLGQPTLAMAMYGQVDEAFAAEERKGSLKARDHPSWIETILNMGGITLATNQRESAKRYCLRVLAWPGVGAFKRVIALEGMVAYHKKRKEWVQMTECCEEALIHVPDANNEPNREVEMFAKEVSMLLLLADAAEGPGDLRRAREYDETPRKLSAKNGDAFVDCDRREAMQLLAVGRPDEAAQILAPQPMEYAAILDHSGINLMKLPLLKATMAALKVLVDALVQTGHSDNIHNAELIRADVKETEAILAAYWEGVLEEARWALREQQRAGGPGEAGTGGGGGEAKKKSKAAKRKQQKRKAQQQKRAAEVAAAAAAAAVEGGPGGDVAGGQQAQQQEEKQEEEEEKGQEGDGKDSKQPVTAAAAAMAAMGMEETQELEGEREEEEDECSVCLNAIEKNDAANPAGPPFVCGHRYHAFGLHYWVERCTMKCIEPTCPYCRSPVQEMS